jgi:hypothetical protein
MKEVGDVRIEEDRRKFVKRMNKEAMLNRLKEEPWLAEILRKNFTEDELDKDVAKYLRETAVSQK